MAIDDLEPATSNSYVPVCGTVQIWYPWNAPVVKFALLVTQGAEPEYAPTNDAYVGPFFPMVFAVLNVNSVNEYNELCITGDDVMDGVIVGVTVFDGVIDGVTVLVGVTLLVGVTVFVGVTLLVGVIDGVGVLVGVIVFVGVTVMVGVTVFVGVTLLVGVIDRVGVLVGVTVGVRVFVGVGVGVDGGRIAATLPITKPFLKSIPIMFINREFFILSK